MKPPDDYFYIVRLNEGVWLAEWGDVPGRCCDQGYAHRFLTYEEAAAGLDRIRLLQELPNARLRAVPVKDIWDLWVDGATVRPCIGPMQARRECRRLIDTEGVNQISVKQNGTEVTRWRAGLGWSAGLDIRKSAGGEP